MALYTISDLHLSLSCDKPMDIFPGWEGYVARLERNWRALVSDADTVVLPGDISWEMQIDRAAADFGFLNSLPGRKLILKGNHDLWWTTLTKMRSFLQTHGFDTIDFLHNSAAAVGEYAVCGTRGWMLEESGTDSKLIAREAMRLEASIVQAEKTGLRPVVFLHYPPVTNANVCAELMEVLLRHSITRVYYGHIHGAGAARAFCGERDGIRFELVSCDFVHFTPVLVR